MIEEEKAHMDGRVDKDMVRKEMKIKRKTRRKIKRNKTNLIQTIVGNADMEGEEEQNHEFEVKTSRNGKQRKIGKVKKKH